MNNLKVAFLISGATLMSLTTMGAASAATIVQFTNDEVNLGNDTQINLTNEYAAFGLQFTDVYRYIDERDPFSDAPNQVNGNNLGISNGRFEQNSVINTLGRVDFTTSVTEFTFDWWTIALNSLNVKAYDENNSLVGSFIGESNSSGTYTIVGNIDYFTFEDTGGFVQIANLSYKAASVVPEPGTILSLLAVSGIGLVTKLKKKV